MSDLSKPFARLTPEQISTLLKAVEPGMFPVDPKTGLRPAMPNLSTEDRYARFKYAMGLGLPDFADIPLREREKPAIICGGGYSITKTLPDIRKRMKLSKRTNLIGLNKTNDWLRSKGVIPTYGILADPRPWIAEYMEPHRDQAYIFSSKLDPKIFERFLKAKAKVYLWHPVETIEGESDKDHILSTYPNRSLTLVPGFSTVGLRAVYLISHNSPKVELHGYDGSYDRDADKMYPYEKPNSFSGRPELDRNDRTIKRGGYTFQFLSNTMMTRQVSEFTDMMVQISDQINRGTRKPLELTVAGTGAIPWMAWKAGHHATPERMAKLYGDAKEIDWRPASSRVQALKLLPKPKPMAGWQTPVLAGIALTDL